MKTLEPILVRANITKVLRDIRQEIEIIKSLESYDPEILEELQRAEQETKERFIFLIIDNVRHM